MMLNQLTIITQVQRIPCTNRQIVHELGDHVLDGGAAELIELIAVAMKNPFPCNAVTSSTVPRSERVKRKRIFDLGSGTPRREFLHVDDLAEGLLHLCTVENPPDLVNIGSGSDVTILKLAQKIAAVVGYEGEVRTAPSKPDGTPVKLTDMTLMHSTGWSAQTDLVSGLKLTYENFLAETNTDALRQA